MSIISVFKKMNLSNTERPLSLEADALARYDFATKYCKGKKILDIGTGLGLGAKYLLENGALSVTGIDYSPQAIKVASQIKEKNLNFKVLNALKLNKLKTQYDVVIAFEVVEHLPVERVDDFFKQVSDLLNKDGLMIVTTPNGLKTRFVWGKPYNPFHIKEYTGNELEEKIIKYFPGINVEGMDLKNSNYANQQTIVSQSLGSKIAYYLGHIKTVRQVMSFVPRDLKRKVTKEVELPQLKANDYRLSSDWFSSEGLFVKAYKGSKNITKRPHFSIIIANYNGEKYLKTCLDSVLKSAYKDFEVIICDDGSVDKSKEIVRNYIKKDKRVVLCENERNMGAAATRNRASRVARGDYLIFLDNDTEVDSQWLQEMEKTIKRNPKLGACQAKLRDFERRNIIQTSGVLIWASTGWSLPRGQWEEDKGQWDREDEIIATSGAMLIKRSVFELVEGFDEDEGVTTEDLDLSWRIWLTGSSIALSPKSIVYHLNKPISMRKNLKQSFEKTYFNLTKNALTSILKNYEGQNAFKYFFYCLMVCFGRSFLVLIKRSDPSSLTGTTKALLWIIVQAPKIIKKRMYTQRIRKLTDDELFDKVLVKKSLWYIYKNYFIQTELI